MKMKPNHAGFQGRAVPQPDPVPGANLDPLDPLDPLDLQTDALIARILSQPPHQLNIPENFAAITARRALAQPQAKQRLGFGWGPSLAVSSFAVLTAGMFAFAPHAAPSLSNARFDAELISLCELCGLLLFSHRLFSRD